MKLLSILLPLFIILNSCSSSKRSIANEVIPPILQKDDFGKYFTNCGSEGSITIYDVNKKILITSDSVDFRKETLPASSFKIVNTLIALETGVIKNVNDTIEWTGEIDTVKYGNRPDIYHDMTVVEAFKVSAAWVFVELSKRIGWKNYQRYLLACHYGNGKLGMNDPDFWNNGEFGVSPIDQIRFLLALYDGTLPFSKQHIDTVRGVMIDEVDKEFTIRAKTGWTREGGVNTGWWVGWVETTNGTFIFTTRLIQDRKNNRSDFGSCRKEITKSVLRDLLIIPFS